MNSFITKFRSAQQYLTRKSREKIHKRNQTVILRMHAFVCYHFVTNVNMEAKLISIVISVDFSWSHAMAIRLLQ